MPVVCTANVTCTCVCTCTADITSTCIYSSIYMHDVDPGPPTWPMARLPIPEVTLRCHRNLLGLRLPRKMTASSKRWTTESDIERSSLWDASLLYLPTESDTERSSLWDASLVYYIFTYRWLWHDSTAQVGGHDLTVRPDIQYNKLWIQDLPWAGTFLQSTGKLSLDWLWNVRGHLGNVTHSHLLSDRK